MLQVLTPQCLGRLLQRVFQWPAYLRPLLGRWRLLRAQVAVVLVQGALVSEVVVQNAADQVAVTRR